MIFKITFIALLMAAPSWAFFPGGPKCLNLVKTVLEGPETGLRVSIEFSEANELLKIYMARPELAPFAKGGGCESRGYIVAKDLYDRGIESQKVLLKGKRPESLIVPTLLGPEKFNYHWGILLKIQNGDQTEDYIMDLSMGQILEYKSWKEMVKKYSGEDELGSIELHDKYAFNDISRNGPQWDEKMFVIAKERLDHVINQNKSRQKLIQQMISALGDERINFQIEAANNKVLNLWLNSLVNSSRDFPENWREIVQVIKGPRFMELFNRHSYFERLIRDDFTLRGTLRSDWQEYGEIIDILSRNYPSEAQQDTARKWFDLPTGPGDTSLAPDLWKDIWSEKINPGPDLKRLKELFKIN